MKRFRRSRPISEQIALFWDRVHIVGPDECWEWTMCIGSHGYGVMRFCGQNWTTHTLSWFLTRGSLPILPLKVLHHCDNRPCCHPGHLFSGDDLENSLDMSAKNRAPLTNATLTAETAKYAADLVRSGLSQSEVGRKFGVSRQNMCNLMHGRCWPEVTGIRPETVNYSYSKPKGAPCRRTSEERTQC